LTKVRNSKHPVIVRGLKNGLYTVLEKYKLDGRTAPVRAMNRARAGLLQLFPKGANAPAAIIIDRIMYKALKLAIFEGMDMAGEPVTAGGEQRYLTMANSLREDLRLLSALADKKPPEAGAPSLQEYLASLKPTAEVVDPEPVKRTLF